jgi:hypothetical protein
MPGFGDSWSRDSEILVLASVIVACLWAVSCFRATRLTRCKYLFVLACKYQLV